MELKIFENFVWSLLQRSKIFGGIAFNFNVPNHSQPAEYIRQKLITIINIAIF